MQLNTTTGYAVRLVLYLTEHNGVATGDEICSGTAIPASMLPAIAKPLRKARIITTRRGNQGGFALARRADEITMADIVRAMEGNLCVNRCTEADGTCSLGISGCCKVQDFYLEVQDLLNEVFEARTIASFLDDGFCSWKGGDG